MITVKLVQRRAEHVQPGEVVQVPDRDWIRVTRTALGRDGMLRLFYANGNYLNVNPLAVVKVQALVGEDNRPLADDGNRDGLANVLQHRGKGSS